MKTGKPSYYRARLALFRDLTSNGADKEKETVLLRNGVMLDKVQQEKLVQAYLEKGAFPEGPLSFEEICSFNTFFEMYAEKVAGTEVVTSSREFPLAIKGTKETIEAAIGSSIAADLLILPPPAPWKIAALESKSGKFSAHYRNGAKSIYVEQDPEGGFNLTAFEKDEKTLEKMVGTIGEANMLILDLMRKRSSSHLELEALALETELNLLDL